LKWAFADAFSECAKRNRLVVVAHGLGQVVGFIQLDLLGVTRNYFLSPTRRVSQNLFFYP
jgi:hypothetical protein